MVDERLQGSEETDASFTERFNDRVEILAKSLVMLMVPMFGLIMLILFPKQPFPVVGSLVFATHLFSFMLLIQAVVAPLLLALINFIVPLLSLKVSGGLIELAFSLILVTIFTWYFYLACIRVYNTKGITLLIKVFIYALSVYWVYLIYRMVLFFTTFYTL